MSCGASQVKLGDVTLDLDPTTYAPYMGARRGGVIRLINGGTVVQDRGFNPGDQRISFSGKIVTLSVVMALTALYETTGTFEFVDPKGNILQCYFLPGMESLRVEAIPGSFNGWEYSITLGVFSRISWLAE